MRLIERTAQLPMFDNEVQLFMPSAKDRPRSVSWLRFLLAQARRTVADLETELAAAQAELRAREQQERIA